MTQPTSPPLEPVDETLQDLTLATARLARANNADQGVCDALDRLGARWRSPRLPVVVVGEVSRGKSTLINALLHRRLLPADFQALTSTWVRISHGTRLTATAFLVDGSGQPSAREIDAAQDLAVYLTVEGAERLTARHGRGARVLSVDITVPAAALESGLELIDTPGVGGLQPAHRRATLAALAEADAVIFVTKPGEPLSESERAFLAEAVDRVAACVIVQTFRDLTPRADEVLAQDTATLANADQWNALLGDRERAQRLAARFASVPAVAVSARNALDSAEANDDAMAPQLFKASNLAMLQEILGTEILAKGNALHRKNVIRLLEILLHDVRERATQRIAMLAGQDAASAAIEQREARIAKWVELGGDYWLSEYNAACDRIPAELRAFAETRAEELDRQYRQRFTGLGTEEMRAATDQLLQEPNLALGEMIRIGQGRIGEAVSRVRGLLKADGLDGVLEGRQRAETVFDRLGASTGDGADSMDLDDLRPAISGGMLGVGVTGAGMTILQHIGMMGAAAYVPIFWPFVAGAVIFAGIDRHRKARARVFDRAVEILNEVCTEIRTTAVNEAKRTVRESMDTVAAHITEALDGVGEQVRADRRDLAESVNLTPDQRALHSTEAADAKERADELLARLARVQDAI